MAEGFGPFHVPQQSRRDKLRIVVPNHPSCQEAAATLDGCAGLLPLYDPSLLSSDMLACSNPSSAHEFHHQNNPLAGTGELCKQNPVYVGGFVNVSSSSTSSHHPYLDPHSSLALNPGSIQDINTNPFLYSAQNLRDFDHSFNGGEVVTFKPEPLSLTHDSTTTGQGLSLSLSSQRYESALFAEKGIGGYVGRGIVAGGASTSNDVSRNSVPLGPFTGYASVLKASRFLKPAQQLLEEFCDVGRGICVESSCGDLALMDPSMENLTGNGAVDDPLTSACGDSIEHRRKRSTLLSMLQEVYRRYGLYYQQMQTVVASFESVAGLCNAAPFTSLALKTLLKHFRCLKNIISDQLRFASKTLGDGSYGRDGTPRMGTTNQGLHSQRPVHNSGILEHQHVWRPQRGLPERAVAVLKAWLFEHFLHPYPTDTDKQMLAKQTGLSRNQVSNWFINARVRLWKPMVEEIHMLETRQAQKASEGTDRNADNLVDHPPSTDPLPSETQPQTTPTLKMQNPPTKRCRNELPTIPYRSNETMNFSYHNLSSHHDVGIGVGTTGGNSGVSLTLGLRQNNGISLSEPFPINIAHRFGLEANNDGYVFGGFEAPNRRFGNDIGG